MWYRFANLLLLAKLMVVLLPLLPMVMPLSVMDLPLKSLSCSRHKFLYFMYILHKKSIL